MEAQFYHLPMYIHCYGIIQKKIITKPIFRPNSQHFGYIIQCGKMDLNPSKIIFGLSL